MVDTIGNRKRGDTRMKNRLAIGILGKAHPNMVYSFKEAFVMGKYSTLKERRRRSMIKRIEESTKLTTKQKETLLETSIESLKTQIKERTKELEKAEKLLEGYKQ